MAKRILVKVAKELNVGTTTLVDHLREHGMEIDNHPRSNVTDEMYDVLRNKFQKSIFIKEKAEKITIGSRNQQNEGKGKEESVKQEASPKEESAKKKPKEQEAKKKESAKKEVEAPKEEEPKAPEQKEEPTPEEENKPSFTVVGKIDLKEVGKGKRKRRSSKKKEEKPKSDTGKKVEKASPKKEEKTTPKEQPKKEATPKEEVSKKEPAEKKPAAEKETPKKEEAPVKEESDAKKSEESTGGDEENVEKTKAPQLKGLKILGKIKLEPKKRKKRKRKKDDDKKPKDDKVAKEGDDKKKRRRRRKVASTEGSRVKDHRSSSSNSSSSNSSNSGSSKRSRRRKGGRKGAKGKEEVKEVSQKEIQEKIKETMKRLEGGGKRRRRHGSSRSERDERKDQERIRKEAEEEEAPKLQVTEFVSVAELAGLMEVSPTEVISTCMGLGVFVSINQRLDAEIIELVAAEYDYEVDFVSAEDQIDIEDEEIEDAPEDLEPRAPIVTVMGHVDHGKTSLLDYIRRANVASGEAGGITQHIGAYEVKVKDKGSVTFLDTPGHEAFTAMRARGAKVTDVAVIIIAADDNVMPQTREAISHAQAAGVPIVFAINKIDKDGANPERIKNELAEMSILVEDWGGEYQSQDISAKQGENVEELLEKILLEAELLDLKANPDRDAIGVVVEASLDKGRGYVTKTLVQTGTLKIGDSIVAGGYSGRVKAMFNELGNRVEEAGPSTPVLILGLDGAPQAGEKLKVMESEQEARQLASKRAQLDRQQQIRATRRMSLDVLADRLEKGTKDLNLIVKGDVDGSVEALADSLLKLSTDSVQINVVHKAVGGITESDVLLASASDAIIIGFQVRPNPTARQLAEREGVEVKTYSVIYDAIDEIKSAIEGLLDPEEVEDVVAQVEIRDVFKISKVGAVAGCFVTSGKITRNTFIRIYRDDRLVYPKKEGSKGELASLRRYKDDVREVQKGFECGLTIKNFNDIEPGDIIEGYEVKQVKQTLD